MQSICAAMLLVTVAAAQPAPAPAPAPVRLSTVMDRDAVIARAGDLTVTVGEYLDAVKNYFGDRQRAKAYKPGDDKPLADALVQGLVEQQVNGRVMRQLGYDEQPRYQAALKLLQWRYLEKIDEDSLPPFTEKDLTEADLRDAYQRYSVVPVEHGISFRFIFFRTLGLDEPAVQAKHALAGKTLARVTGGEPFFEVMKEISEVAEPRENPYWVDENTKGFDPKIYQILSGMQPGEISPVIETRGGLFILRRFPKPKREEVKPFDEMMADPQGHKQLVRDALETLEMNKRKWLLDQIGNRYEAGAIETTDMATLGKLAEGTPIMKVGGQTLTLADLKAALNQPFDKCTTDDINQKVVEMSKQMILAQYAHDEGLSGRLATTEDYQRDLTRLRQDYMVFTSRAEVPDMSEEAMQAFYDTHREEFREMCRADARQILVKPVKGDSDSKEVLALVVRDEAQRLKDQIEKGQTFDQAVSDGHDDRFKVELARWDDELPGRIVFGDGKYGSSLLDSFGKVLGPERVRDGFVIYSLTGQLPGKIIPFDQAKSQINQLNKKQVAGEKIKAAYEAQMKDLKLTEDLLYIPDDLKPGWGK